MNLGGWKGYFANGDVTDSSSWKCTNAPQADNAWVTSGFDDSSWVVPAQSNNNNMCYFSAAPTAMWLWPFSNYSGSIIYCRRVLGRLLIVLFVV